MPSRGRDQDIHSGLTHELMGYQDQSQACDSHASSFCADVSQLNLTETPRQFNDAACQKTIFLKREFRTVNHQKKYTGMVLLS